MHSNFWYKTFSVCIYSSHLKAFILRNRKRRFFFLFLYRINIFTDKYLQGHRWLNRDIDINEQNRDGRGVTAFDSDSGSRMLNGWRQPPHSHALMIIIARRHALLFREGLRTTRTHNASAYEYREGGTSRTDVCGRRRRQNVQRIGRDDVVLRVCVRVYKTGSAIGRIDPSPWRFLATCSSQRVPRDIADVLIRTTALIPINSEFTLLIASAWKLLLLAHFLKQYF